MLEEIKQQRRRLLRDRRTPARMLVCKDESTTELLCSASFLTPGMYRIPEPGVIGWLYGLPVVFSDRPGVLVIPEDWGGFGQGRVRV